MRKNNTWASLDWITVLVFLILVFAGWMNIYSAVYDENANHILDFSKQYGKQALWILFSFVLAFFVLVTDSKFFVSFSYVLYAITILLLIVVLIFGREVNASKSWLVIGSFSIQPAEFAKLGAALVVSRLVSSHGFTFNSLRNTIRLGVLVFLPAVLIFLQNDTGSALVYFIFIIPLFREGMSGLVLFFAIFFVIIFVLSLLIKPVILLIVLLTFALLLVFIMRRKFSDLFYLLAILGSSMLFVWLIALLVGKTQNVDLYFLLMRALVISSLLIIAAALFKRIKYVPLIASIFLASILFSFTVDFAFNNLLEKHQRTRISHLLGIESDPLGAGYNVNQSKIAIGSGGFSGKGYLQGTQTKYDFVPEQSTDFIFCTVGEEWGFIGSGIVVGLFIFLIIRIIVLAERQRSVFSRIFGYSVASIIFFHFTINIGMTIGLAPVIGIPLPFFSYGGSSLWLFTLLLFIFLKLDTNRKEQLH